MAALSIENVSVARGPRNVVHDVTHRGAPRRGDCDSRSKWCRQVEPGTRLRRSRSRDQGFHQPGRHEPRQRSPRTHPSGGCLGRTRGSTHAVGSQRSKRTSRVATYSLGKRAAADGLAYTLSLFPELEKRWTIQGRLLSGGEQQMVVLAQALVSRPKVLLVDELSLGLAPIVVKRLVPTLAQVAASGVAVLLIEQFAHVALSLAKAAYVLEGGRVRYSGSAAELIEQPGAAALRLPASRARSRHNVTDQATFATGEHRWPADHRV